jgi:hypothetical protein
MGIMMHLFGAFEKEGESIKLLKDIQGNKKETNINLSETMKNLFLPYLQDDTLK